MLQKFKIGLYKELSSLLKIYFVYADISTRWHKHAVYVICHFLFILIDFCSFKCEMYFCWLHITEGFFLYSLKIFFSLGKECTSFTMNKILVCLGVSLFYFYIFSICPLSFFLIIVVYLLSIWSQSLKYFLKGSVCSSADNAHPSHYTVCSESVICHYMFHSWTTIYLILTSISLLAYPISHVIIHMFYTCFYSAHLYNNCTTA